MLFGSLANGETVDIDSEAYLRRAVYTYQAMHGISISKNQRYSGCANRIVISRSVRC